MTAEETLAGVQRVLIDTNAIVYIVEKRAEAPKVWAVLREAMRTGAGLVVSPLTLIEVLSKPGMTEPELKQFAEFCLATNEIEFTPLVFDDTFAMRVGYFRRMTSVKTPDCIQFACAERLHCDAILTNDPDYRKHPNAKCILVSEVDI